MCYCDRVVRPDDFLCASLDTWAPTVTYCPSSFVFYTQPEDIVTDNMPPSVNISWSQPKAADNVGFTWTADSPTRFVTHIYAILLHLYIHGN